MDAGNRKILSTSDLIFSQAASTSVHSQLASIKRSTLSIANRLRSIEQDADWVRWVAAHYGRASSEPSHYGGYDGVFLLDQTFEDVATSKRATRLPIIANERCGSWYIPPWEKTGGSSYWKSTDGHWGVWNFSLRRLNLNVIDVLQMSRADGVAGGCGGAMVVDSTRQGKHLPDAFTKTVPIWCAVINRLLFPEANASLHTFRRCESIVSESEAAQIEAKLPSLVQAVRELDLEVALLKSKLGKPIRCFWVARGLVSMPLTPVELLEEERRSASAMSELEYHPLYLCMASEFQESATQSSYSGYVQGAGDDAEAWACGLTPTSFWQNRDMLLDNDTPEDHLPRTIQNLVTSEAEHLQEQGGIFRTTCILSDGHLLIGAATGRIISIPNLTQDDMVIVCSPNSNIEVQGITEQRVLHLNCAQGKPGSRALRKELDRLDPFLGARCSAGADGDSPRLKKVFVTCETGKDLSVGVALVLLCLYVDQDGIILHDDTQKQKTVDKLFIRQKLSAISTAAPTINPSRATLNSVNSFLMKR